MSWHLGPLLGWDTETTSADPDTARIVTCTVVECGPQGIVRTREWLINPGVPISPGATAVHGITDARAAEDGQPAVDAIQEIADVLGIWLEQGLPVVAFNASFDATILDRECRRHNVIMPEPFAPIVDPFCIDKQLDRFRKGKRTLTATCERHGVKLEGAHTATGDALAAVRLAYVLGARNLTLSESTLPDLHAHQQVWRAEQAASLQTYFRKTNPDAVVNGDWPIQALPDGWTPQLVDQPEDVPA